MMELEKLSIRLLGLRFLQCSYKLNEMLETDLEKLSIFIMRCKCYQNEKCMSLTIGQRQHKMNDS